MSRAPSTPRSVAGFSGPEQVTRVTGINRQAVAGSSPANSGAVASTSSRCSRWASNGTVHGEIETTIAAKPMRRAREFMTSPLDSLMKTRGLLRCVA